MTAPKPTKGRPEQVYIPIPNQPGYTRRVTIWFETVKDKDGKEEEKQAAKFHEVWSEKRQAKKKLKLSGRQFVKFRKAHAH